jgi:hypothetical protein
MNTNRACKETLNEGGSRPEAAHQGVCQKLLQQLKQAKNNLVAEYHSLFERQEKLLTLALVEADALAWQTDYPHLVFPQLAMEKVQRAVDWRERQEMLLQQTSPYALAA